MLWVADLAGAAEPPPDPSDSALAQYVEQIPTSRGAKPVTSSRGEAAAQPLSPSASAELRAQGGADARLLKKIATSPALGAPERKQADTGRAQPDNPPQAAGAEALGRESAAAELISGRVIALLAIVGGITVGAGLLGALRRRSAEK